jgi:hypothetical protein
MGALTVGCHFQCINALLIPKTSSTTLSVCQLGWFLTYLVLLLEDWRKAKNVWGSLLIYCKGLAEGMNVLPYITSAKGLGGWGQKNGNFADV